MRVQARYYPSGGARVAAAAAAAGKLAVVVSGATAQEELAGWGGAVVGRYVMVRTLASLTSLPSVPHSTRASPPRRGSGFSGSRRRHCRRRCRLPQVVGLLKRDAARPEGRIVRVQRVCTPAHRRRARAYAAPARTRAAAAAAAAAQVTDLREREALWEHWQLEVEHLWLTDAAGPPGGGTG